MCGIDFARAKSANDRVPARTLSLVCVNPARPYVWPYPVLSEETLIR